MKNIHWNDRLLAIVGARGAGKTTMMLQYMNRVIKNGSPMFEVLTTYMLVL
jgi:KaiC/GvpD/RAD55 family RecA-like ATPase